MARLNPNTTGADRQYKQDRTDGMATLLSAPKAASDMIFLHETPPTSPTDAEVVACIKQSLNGVSSVQGDDEAYRHAKLIITDFRLCGGPLENLAEWLDFIVFEVSEGASGQEAEDDLQMLRQEFATLKESHKALKKRPPVVDTESQAKLDKVQEAVQTLIETLEESMLDHGQALGPLKDILQLIQPPKAKKKTKK